MTKNIKMTKNIRWMLIFYDMGVYAIAAFLLLAFYAGMISFQEKESSNRLLSPLFVFLQHVLLGIFTDRFGDMEEYSAISDCCLQTLQDFWHTYV